MTAPLQHVPDRNRFEVREGGSPAVLTYELDGDTVTFTHTVVPADLEGRGIGSRLAAAGTEWAQEQGLQVVAQCTFVRAWLDRQARRSG